jgi:hypothetical protein
LFREFSVGLAQWASRTSEPAQSANSLLHDPEKTAVGFFRARAQTKSRRAMTIHPDVDAR